MISVEEMSEHEILTIAIEHLQFQFVTLTLMQGASPAFAALANQFVNTMPAQVEVLQAGLHWVENNQPCPVATLNLAKAIIGDDE
jgi:hypothetical protein